VTGRGEVKTGHQRGLGEWKDVWPVILKRKGGWGGRGGRRDELVGGYEKRGQRPPLLVGFNHKLLNQGGGKAKAEQKDVAEADKREAATSVKTSGAKKGRNGTYHNLATIFRKFTKQKQT